MQLTAGMVISLPDPRVRPKNRLKWHICVCPERRQVLRINSKPIWAPWHPISDDDNAFLDHDSYVELAMLHFFAESELRGVKKIGDMSRAQQVGLALAAQEARTLNDEQKALILEKLG
jgi:hypothetical protein